jgi:hypothetical protein
MPQTDVNMFFSPMPLQEPKNRPDASAACSPAQTQPLSKAPSSLTVEDNVNRWLHPLDTRKTLRLKKNSLFCLQETKYKKPSIQRLVPL